MFRGINHISIVTDDLDRAVRTWHDRYGVGPWALYRYDGSNMEAVLHGRAIDFEMRVGLCQLEHSRIEIIQPLDDHSPYSESLKIHGGADHIHHVSFDRAEEGVEQRLAELGVPASLEASFGSADGGPGPPVTVTYFACEPELGFTLELARFPTDFIRPAPEAVYPPTPVQP
jgi:catechol 2,3-dioxygenase-like lactoylglutathione lyase family enzyme